MTFLALDAQKNLFTLQKSQLQFEQTLVMSRVNYVTKQMGYRANGLDGTDTDVDDDPRACYFKQANYGKFIRMALILKLLEEK